MLQKADETVSITKYFFMLEWMIFVDLRCRVTTLMRQWIREQNVITGKNTNDQWNIIL